MALQEAIDFRQIFYFDFNINYDKIPEPMYSSNLFNQSISQLGMIKVVCTLQCVILQTSINIEWKMYYAIQMSW